MGDEFIYSLLKYWRNSLADACRTDIKNFTQSEGVIKVPKKFIAEGKIPEPLAKKLINIYKDKAPKNQKKTKKRVNREWEAGAKSSENEIEEIKVLVCPLRATFMPEHAKDVLGKENPIVPLWIPAKLHRSGRLDPILDDPPWIPRVLLEPVERNTQTIGRVEVVDEFLASHPFPPKITEWKDGGRWANIWRYCNEMLRVVTTGRTLDDFSKEDYQIEPYSYVVLDVLRSTTEDLIYFYDQLQFDLKERQMPVPALLKRYMNLEDETAGSLLSGMEEIKKASEHLGQMSQDFGLTPSQREALHHTLAMKDGEILAVNGPPGTGKTTLLQSIVATLWVEAAVKRGKPPVIVATSTNNQAVTNVIVSFGNVEKEGDDSALAGRWIPDLTSYGLYCPASSRKDEAAGYQRSMQKEGDPRYCFYLARPAEDEEDRTIEDQGFVGEAQTYFLDCCRHFARQEFQTIESAVDHLHRKLVEITNTIKNGVLTWQKVTSILDRISSDYGSEDALNAHLRKLVQNIEQCRNRARDLNNFRKEWVEHTKRAPWWIGMLNFFPPWLMNILPAAKGILAEYNENYFSSVGLQVDGDLADAENIRNFFIRQTNIQKDEEGKLLIVLERAEQARSALNRARQDWSNWLIRNNIHSGSSPLPDFTDIQQLIDIKLRYEAFKLATHYWEGEWLLEMRKFDWSWQAPQSELVQRKRWWRYAKLTPCVVVTLHKLEPFFNAFQRRQSEEEGSRLPLYGFIDLLIVDEAGQVSPDVAGANFSLAKKALVVGDTKQLKPVRSLTLGIDRANMEKHGVAASEERKLAFERAGFSVSEKKGESDGGTVMKIAQRASRYKKPNIQERGMFLAEHHRCVREVIEYCNELVYDGQLSPQRVSDPDYPWPRLGYASIPGNPIQIGNSRRNPIEAQVIIQWILDHRQRLESWFSLSIDKIVAVLTPFKLQQELIEKELGQHAILKGITAGTVHVLQGAERPVILFSPVYGGETPSFIDREPNMLNVAVSRAKESFLVFGDMSIFDPLATRLPSGILARYLFADQANEITDITFPKREEWIFNDGVRQIDTLRDHCEALAGGLQMAKRRVLISSPFISDQAITADGLTKFIREAADRGVSVTIYTDKELNYREKPNQFQLKDSFLRGVEMLENNGARVKLVQKYHRKTMIVDEDLLIEGSFNWLSAVRNPGSDYQREEGSFEYTGENATKLITNTVNKIESCVTGEAKSLLRQSSRPRQSQR